MNTTTEENAMYPHIKITYDIVTPESAEHGDFAESGWHDEEGRDCRPGQYAIDEGWTCVDIAIETLKDAGATYHGDWYSTEYHVQDYSTGEEIQYSYHLYGFTEEEESIIADRLS